MERDHLPTRFHREDQRQALSKEMQEGAQQMFLVITVMRVASRSQDGQVILDFGLFKMLVSSVVFGSLDWSMGPCSDTRRSFFHAKCGRRWPRMAYWPIVL